MKRPACLILTVIILISCLAFVRVSVHATTVSGVITTNTEWTIDDSPITCNGGVRVAPNATLTIDPGVTVNFGTYGSMSVSGTLTAVGAPDNPITFTTPNSQTIGIFPTFLPPPFFQYVNFNNVYISASSSTEIDNCNFSFVTPQTAITVTAGSPTISNNKIVFTGQDPNHNAYGVNVNFGTPTITNNEFDGNGQLTGINAQSSTPFTVSNNLFSNCWIGVKAETRVTLTVQGNTFEGCNDGLDINQVASLTITNNLIDSCLRYGINGGGSIYSNTISNNPIGVHNPYSGSILNNNIVGSSIDSVTAASANVDAQNNWWGTTDAPTINQTVYDFHCDPGLGTIQFVPFLTEPSLSAPAIPLNTPLTTLSPTVEPTHAPVQPTPIVVTPTVAPTPITTQKSETILSNINDLLNLNLIATTVIAAMVLVWIFAILGYTVKNGVTKYNKK